MSLNDNARAWLQELRTTTKKQGKYKLNQNEAYCCLGIACELYINEGNKLDKNKLDYHTEYNNMGGFLPGIVATWLGISSYGIATAISLNDSGNQSFKEIADELEKDTSCFA